MFQNISEKTEKTEEANQLNKYYKLKEIIRSTLKIQNLLLYAITFMLSLVKFEENEFSIFAVAILAATCSNDIPVGVLYIVSLIGTLIKFETSGLLSYMLTTLIFITLILVFRPKRIVEQFQNEKRKLGKFVFLSVLLGQIVKILFREFLIYDFLLGITESIACYIFYKIFSKSIIVINDIKQKRVFALEEIIGTSLMVSIATTCFGEFKIFGIQIGNVISILIVLVLGWKNGILIGTTSGVTIGSVLGIITNSNPILVATYALSGMLAGIFSKFGKIGVIVGFILGNVILNYAYSGNVAELIYFKEIIIASLALLVIPKNIEINVSDLFGKNVILQEGTKYRLEESKETANKLNDVSDVIKQMSDTYKMAAATIVEENEVKENNKEIFIEELQENMDRLKENMFFNDIISEESNISNSIFEYMNEKERINREGLLKVLKDNNSYILENDNYNVSLKMEKDIDDFIKIINDAYKSSKMNFILKTKINENKRTISNQLDGVSKVISDIAKEIETNEKKEYIEEIEKIKLLCKQKNIKIEAIKISREPSNRFIINLIIKPCNENERMECPNKKIEKILSEVLKENIVLQNNKCAIKTNLKDCHQTYVSKDKYLMQIGVSKKTKFGEIVSGDSNIQIKLNDGKYLIAISDGMGAGEKAQKSSKVAVRMLGKLLSNGFAKDTSIKLINDTIALNSENETYATLDIAVLDLYAGNIEFIKNGAAPTYIKNKKNVDIIKNITIPTGIISNIDLIVFDRDIEDNDIIVMCSDGIVESNLEYENKEIWLKNLLEEMSENSAKKISDIILKEAIDNNFGTAKDDMTVITIKLKNKMQEA